MGRISRKLHTLLGGGSQSPPPPPPPPSSNSSSSSRSHPDPVSIAIPIRRSSSFARLPKPPPPAQLLRTSSSSSIMANGKQGYRLLLLGSGSSSGPGTPPKGHLPIRLHGHSSALYFVRAELLNHPIIADLLRRSAEEYGYPSTGALRVSCDAGTFEDIIQGLESSLLSP